MTKPKIKIVFHRGKGYMVMVFEGSKKAIDIAEGLWLEQLKTALKHPRQ